MLFATSALLALLPAFVAAQTFTSCDPTKTTCPPDPGFTNGTTSWNFQAGANLDLFTVLGNPEKIAVDSTGLKFTIDAEKQAPTLTTKDYIFFGKVTAVMQAAPGAGIVSAFILQSDCLDEIDWEWLGGVTTTVQSNYFSRGIANYGNGGVHNVANPQSSFHTYVIDWSPTRIEWSIDGAVVRTVLASTAGAAYPQTPSQIRVGTWCGGCSGSPAGTVTWSGGPTTFSGAPYVMTIQSLEIINANPAGSYTYSDMSGTAGSIKGSSANVSVSGSSSVASATSSSASASKSASGSSASVATKSSGGDSKSSGSPAASGTGAGNKPSGGAGAQTTGSAGPTSNNLPASSSAHKFSLGGVMALVFGAIILVA